MLDVRKKKKKKMKTKQSEVRRHEKSMPAKAET